MSQGWLFGDESRPLEAPPDAPLAARMRPRSFEEFVGQEHLTGEGAALRRLVEEDRLSSIILWGPPGVGKTTLAEVIANTTKAHFTRVSATTAGVADLRKAVPVERLKAILQDLQCISEKLFVVQNHLRDVVVQAFALGATAVVSRPSEIVSKLAQVEFAQRRSEPALGAPPPELTGSVTSFSSLFVAASRGKQITLSDAENATQEVINGIRRSGLNAWLDDVRRYHEGTFQHCLLVTGGAVAFAMSIRFPDADVMRLGLAATLHDVGKARIPLTILDKPDRLDPSEQEIMNRHPVIGHDLLKTIPGISPEILDGVRHHHEYLDGSGYPDGLTAPQISDLVRLLTISDIFAAGLHEYLTAFLDSMQDLSEDIQRSFFSSRVVE